MNERGKWKERRAGVRVLTIRTGKGKREKKLSDYIMLYKGKGRREE